MKKELRRQFFHYFFGCIIILSIGFLEITNSLIANMIILFIGYFLSVKIKEKKEIPIINNLIKKLLNYAGRQKEKGIPGKGALTFFTGTLLAAILFHNNSLLVIGAIIPLVFGDSFSTVFGKLIGKIKIQDKTLEGSIAGIIISFIYLSFLFPYSIALTAAAIGMSMEYLPIEDNYTIPIATGFVLMLLIYPSLDMT